MRHLNWSAKTEPSLHEVFKDPIVRQMMTCDHVSDDDLIDLIVTVRHQLAVHAWRRGEPRVRAPRLDETAVNQCNPLQWKPAARQAPKRAGR